MPPARSAQLRWVCPLAPPASPGFTLLLKQSNPEPANNQSTQWDGWEAGDASACLRSQNPRREPNAPASKREVAMPCAGLREWVLATAPPCPKPTQQGLCAPASPSRRMPAHSPATVAHQPLPRGPGWQRDVVSGWQQLGGSHSSGRDRVAGGWVGEKQIIKTKSQ